MLPDNKQKKTLAPRRDTRLTAINPELKKNTPRLPGNIAIQKPLNNHTPISLGQQKHVSHAQTFQQKYKNKSLSSLPAPLLIAFHGLTTLDISNNRLNDQQLQLLMNSCTKLTTLCIQGNVNLLIPASIYKLKQLSNFRHDWSIAILNKQQCYEQNLPLLKNLVQKPQNIIKLTNKTFGLDIQNYFVKVANVKLDLTFLSRIQVCIFLSTHAKELITKFVKDYDIKNKAKAKHKPLLEQQEFIACNVGCAFNKKSLEIPQKPMTIKQKDKQKKPQSIFPKSKGGSNKQTEPTEQSQDFCNSKSIKIESIKEISSICNNESTAKYTSTQKDAPYSDPDMPFHQLLGNFDIMANCASKIDGLLLKGYNPNQYDSRGLSAYHICVLQNQKKGFDYLLNICGNNPGFFDLEMASVKECRNILHFCVFLKNYSFTKKLIQFGFPLYKRDSSGYRLIHMVDNNCQFLLLLRKLLRKSMASARSQSTLAIHYSRKRYVKHPQREKQEAKFQIRIGKNEDLLRMFESAQGLSGKRSTL